VKVYWTEAALAHLSAIQDYIAKDSSRYALAMVDRITRRSKQIAAFPLSGEKVKEIDREEIREMLESPYRVVYRVFPDRIDVLAVVHGARRLPDVS
jgi:plasmid stabilization system protein ParE